MTNRKSMPYKFGEKALKDLYNEEYEENPFDRVRLVIHLKQRMKERNITQTQLSELADVRQATISQLSRGHIERLHVPTLEKIAAALNIDDITKLLTFEVESEIMNAANPFDITFSNNDHHE